MHILESEGRNRVQVVGVVKVEFGVELREDCCKEKRQRYSSHLIYNLYIQTMSEYFRKYIKKEHYPNH